MRSYKRNYQVQTTTNTDPVTKRNSSELGT